MTNPAAVALGDQMHARMLDTATDMVRAELAAEDLTATERDQDFIDMGIAAGMTAAMQVLVELGLLKVEGGRL